MTEIRVHDSGPDARLVDSIVEIHVASSIENGQTIADFVAPYTLEKRRLIKKSWEDKLELCRPGGPDVLVTSFDRDAAGDEQLSGCVQLHMPPSESGPMRAFVQRLFVSPDFRRRGIATKLMRKLEDVALERGRWLVTLSTASPSPAHGFYPTLGYIEYGEIPNYIVHGETGELMGETCFYKDLRHIKK